MLGVGGFQRFDVFVLEFMVQELCIVIGYKLSFQYHLILVSFFRLLHGFNAEGIHFS